MKATIVRFFYFIILMMSSQVNAKEQEPNYIKYVHEIVNKFSKEMKQRFGLVCVGSGGSMPHDVEYIRVCFEICRKVSIEEARELEVKATEALVKRINAHEKIRPYLRQFPFSVEGTEIPIAFVDDHGDHHADGGVTFLFQVRNQMYYVKKSKKDGPLEPLYEESYEEAYNKVYPPKINPQT